MAGTTSRPEAGRRFDAAERFLHWTVAALVLTLLFTGASLYAGPLSTLVGRRELVKTVHLVAGLSLPVPFLVAFAGPWAARLRADVRLLNRWDDGDLRWVRTGGREGGTGRFNAGQKLNAAFVAGALAVMLLTGAVLAWYTPFPDDWRTGATFVHDWTFLALAVVVAAHVVIAWRHPASLAAMGVPTRRRDRRA